MDKTIYIITNSPANDIHKFRNYLNEIVERVFSDKIELKDGTILIFHSDENRAGIHNWYYFHEIFESYLKAQKVVLQQQCKKQKEVIDRAIEYINQNVYEDDNGCGEHWWEITDKDELSHKKYELENLNEEKAKENKQLKDNWNKLKKYISVKLYNTEYLQKLCGCRIDDINHILLDAIKEEMQELEKGSENCG